MSESFLRVGLVLLCWLFTGSAMANPLQVSVKPGQITGSIDVSLTNTGAETVSVLLWDTPFEHTLSNNVFLVEKAVKGFPFLQASKYSGRSVKRSKPSVEHYRVIQPGEMISANLTLNEHYDITQFGEHSVRFAGDIRYEVINGLQGRAKNTFGTINTMNRAELLTDSVAVSLTPNLRPRLRTPTYDSCSVQERVDIVEAAEIAEILINTALSGLQGLVGNDRVSSPRYNAWFGKYSDSRFSQVVSNFTAIDQALENETLQFNCDCTESGIFAFVFPAFPYSMTLCPSFRSANANGQDSRAGTIIHELSHFINVAGTDDHVYGQDGARALAISNPDLVISNADSYEYFAENAPPVPISQSGTVTTPITYPSLQLGTQSQESILEGQALTFQVTNANRIELVSNSGDADLYVYRDDQLSDEICQSRNRSSTADLCEVFVNGMLYAQVRGFTDATFTLIADGESSRPNDDTIELALGVPVTDSVGANDRDIYQVNGGGIVELESLTGDADLFVFNGLDLTAGTLVCSSTATPEQSTMDRCNIPATQSTYYVTVVGYTAASYSLVARSTVSASAIRLTPGQLISGDVTAGSFHYYLVSGVESVVLTSVTGNADLRVTSDPEFQENGTSCTSVEFSSDSLTDSCTVTNGSEHYILVRGDTDATYTIIGNAGNTAPASDDPNAPIPVSAGHKLGAAGPFGLLLLVVFVGFRVTKRG
ncbi:MAG: peptidyl-Lys metalloendopeptidase [Granulosicoccus sp.]|jgi:peptidyl-Lys metalloendopeptidase